MRCLILLAFVALVAAEQIEFYSLDGRRADPCVNDQRLDAGAGRRPDCTDNSVLPWPSTTYLVPAASSPVTRQLSAATSITLTGNFFPAAGFRLQLSRAGTTSCSSTALNPVGAVAPALPAITAIVRTATTMVFTIPAAWANIPEEETYGRALCFVPASEIATAAPGGQWTGLRIATVWNCDGSDTVANQCGARFNAFNFNLLSNLDDVQKAVLISRTTCCINKVQSTTEFKVNQCINPNVETCCGGAAVLPQMKCCQSNIETIAWADGTCPCRKGTSTTDCPTGESCCLPIKYTELIATATLTDNNRAGECYNAQTHRCCDVGKKYDPGSMQCCSINGLQSVNVPCPCGADADCVGGQVNYRQLDSKCCIQQAPAPMEGSGNCNKYLNYPGGNGHYSQQQCLGQCIDTRFQVCCNGRSCVREYESCCNSTCCNRFNGTCQSGASRRSSTTSNWVELGVSYDVCTTVEQIDVIRAWWMFVLPTALLAASLASLALALVFAGRVEHASRRGLEKGVIFVAIAAILFGIPTFFSPVYKYGLVVVFASLFTIITAAARKMKMYIANVVLIFIVLFFLVDPLHGNDYLNLSIDRASNSGRADPRAAGLWHATSRMWDHHDTCYDFYAGYFKFDTLLRDSRIDEASNNNPAFGYCSRGWVSTLLVVGGFVYIALIVQLILSTILLLVRGAMLRKAAEVKWD